MDFRFSRVLRLNVGLRNDVWILFFGAQIRKSTHDSRRPETGNPHDKSTPNWTHHLDASGRPEGNRARRGHLQPEMDLRAERGIEVENPTRGALLKMTDT